MQIYAAIPYIIICPFPEQVVHSPRHIIPLAMLFHAILLEKRQRTIIIILIIYAKYYISIAVNDQFRKFYRNIVALAHTFKEDQSFIYLWS